MPVVSSGALPVGFQHCWGPNPSKQGNNNDCRVISALGKVPTLLGTVVNIALIGVGVNGGCFKNSGSV